MSDAPQDLTLPHRVGPYELRSRLRSGGQAVVFRAHDRTLDVPVAVKIPHEKYQPRTEQEVELFLREPRLMARIHHPNVVRVFAACEPPGFPWYATVYELAAGDLAAYIGRVEGRRSLLVPVALRIAYQIALGLEVIHTQQIVHRDLKPQNILFFDDPTDPSLPSFRIGDFGVSRYLPPDESAQTIVGTYPWMAREVWRKETTTRSDLWALGAILYELLTGRLPYDAPNIASYLLKLEREDPVPPSRAHPGLPPVLDDLVLHALARDPERRIPTARAFRDLLAALMSQDELDTVIPVRPHGGQGADGITAVLPATATPPFRLRVWTERPESPATRDIRCVPRIESNAARIGDALRIRCEVDRDAYVTLVNVGPRGRVTVLFPNAFASANFVRAGAPVMVPDERQGFDCRLEPPAGRETILAYATLDPIRLISEDVAAVAPDPSAAAEHSDSRASESVARRLSTRLASIPRDRWTQARCYLDVLE